jgi:hypothetical protein
MTKVRPKCFPRFARQFGKACGDFHIVTDDGLDNFLVVLDRDGPSQSLLWWLNYKRSKSPRHFRLNAVHLFVGDGPDPETASYLSEFCEKLQCPILFHGTGQIDNKDEYFQVVGRIAVEQSCNKVAVPDSIDFMNAAVLMTMAEKAVYDGPSVVENLKLEGVGEVLICRPFCYCTDAQLEEWATASEFHNTPTGLRIPPKSFLELAVRALDLLKNTSSNHKMNFFKSQFQVQKKYLGVGVGSVDDGN